MVVKHIWLQLNAKNIVQGKYLFGKDKTIGKKNYQWFQGLNVMKGIDWTVPEQGNS